LDCTAKPVRSRRGVNLCGHIHTHRDTYIAGNVVYTAVTNIPTASKGLVGDCERLDRDVAMKGVKLVELSCELL